MTLFCPWHDKKPFYLPAGYKGWRTSQPWTFQPQASTQDLSTPEFSTMNLSTMNFSTPWFKNSWLKSSGLESSWLKSLGLKGPGFKIGVEKSGVEMSFNRYKSRYTGSLCIIFGSGILVFWLRNILRSKHICSVGIVFGNEKCKPKKFFGTIYLSLAYDSAK